MARIRTIKPEILEDANTAGLSDSAFRLFVAMIVLADDHGNVRADDRWLGGQVWWARSDCGDSPRVAEILGELADAQLIGLYECRSQHYASISGWQKHQRIDNAGKPRVPLPSDGSPISAEILRESPRNAAGPRPPTTTTSTDLSGKPDTAASSPASPDPAVGLAEVAVREINRLGRKHYRSDSETVTRLCRALAKAKRTAAQVVAVVESKRSWVGDPKMAQYFSPSTLLAAANFAKYLDEIEATRKPVRSFDSTPPPARQDDDEPDLTYSLWNVPA
jgi:uncharacterized phage protein (TIGR02220 family)